MPFNVRAVATIAGTVLLLSAGIGLADDTTPRPPGTVPVKKSAPAAIRVPKTTELPPSALGIDTKPRGYEPGDESDAKLPNQFQLGNNTLHIDADKKSPVPPVGLETNEQSVLNKAPAEPALKPSYFGLRLTSPMNLFTR